MPKATLLGTWGSFTLKTPLGDFSFKAGVTRKVPMSVAVRLKDIKTGDAKPMFKVEGLKEVEDYVHPQQTVDSALTQLRFGQWPLH